MIDRDTAVTLIQEAGARLGLAADHPWTVTEVDDLGWRGGPGIRRSSLAVAVTPRGKLATFTHVAHSAADALRILAAVPDDLAPPHPSQAGDWHPQPLDEAAALALVRRQFEDTPDARTDWRATQIQGQGWIFRSGPDTATVVVTNQRVVRIIPPGQTPEQALAAETVPNLLALIKTLRSADDADGSPDRP